MDKDTREMFEILHENKERMRTKELIEKQLIEDNKKIAKRQRKAIVTGVLIIIMLILSLMAIAKLDKDFINDCTKGGLSESVCKNAM